MAEIKKIVSKLYEFNLKNSILIDGDEILSKNNINSSNEFINTFRLRNLDSGIIVLPSGYVKGLIYKVSNGGEIYNNPDWLPDIVTFSFNILGLKPGSFYRLSTIGRNVRKFNPLSDTTKDRKLLITNNYGESLIDVDFENAYENTTFSNIFRADSTEIDLYFRMGKIYLNNVILEEVELTIDSEVKEIKENENSISSGKFNVVSYSVFSTDNIKEKVSSNSIMLNKITGRGLVLIYEKNSGNFFIERDNTEDIMSESFTNINYLLDINMNKFTNNGLYDLLNIVEVSSDISPHTLKAGYVKFNLLKNGKSVTEFSQDKRISIIITKIL